jgi:RimJ/RimL family protein N-acetyltransferase
MEIPDIVRIQQGQLLLRPIAEADTALIAAASLTDVPDWTYIPRDLSEQAARNWIRQRLPARQAGRAIRFVIEQDSEPVGTIGAEHPYANDGGIIETFYFILPEFRRRGIATIALKLIDEWAQQVTPELRRLQLHVVVGNPGSGKVAEMAGYHFEGLAVNKVRAVNGFEARHAMVYGLAVLGSDGTYVGDVQA